MTPIKLSGHCRKKKTIVQCNQFLQKLIHFRILTKMYCIFFVLLFWLMFDDIIQATTSQTKLKSLKSSTACSSSLTTDVCKENKERHSSTNKAPTISYGKKEKSTNISLLQRKKGKVLCDVIASTSAAPPIPTKRQKVVSTKKFMSNDKPDTKESAIFNLDMNNLNLKSDDVPALAAIASTAGDDLSVFVDKPTMITTAAIAASTASAAVAGTMAPMTTVSTATTFNPDVPCCSYQMLPQTSNSFNPFKYPNAPKKSSNFLRKSSASTASMLSMNPSAMGPGGKGKSSAIKLRCNSFSGASGSTNNGSRLKSSLRKSSLKKKKSLKADAGIKRNKPKVF